MTLRTPATPFADEVITGLTGFTPEFMRAPKRLKCGLYLDSDWEIVDLSFGRPHWIITSDYSGSARSSLVDLPTFVEKLKELL